MLKKEPHPSRLAEHIMSHLKTWKILVKTFHIPTENLKCFDFLDFDFYPFLPYSMNKRRRWEVDFLEDLSEVQMENFDVLFLERTRKGAYDWARYLETTLPEQFRIRGVHWLSEDVKESDSQKYRIPLKIYKKQTLNSIFGQDFKNFDVSKDLQNRGIVAYNFLDSPKNHMKLFGRKCISKKDDAWPYTTGWIRIRRRKNLMKELRFSEDDEGDSDGICDSENEEGGVEKVDRKYYDLMDHVVENQRRLKNKKRC